MADWMASAREGWGLFVADGEVQARRHDDPEAADERAVTVPQLADDADATGRVRATRSGEYHRSRPEFATNIKMRENHRTGPTSLSFTQLEWRWHRRERSRPLRALGHQHLFVCDCSDQLAYLFI